MNSVHAAKNRSLNFELFFELSPDLLCIAGFDGYFRGVNPAVCKLLGYTMEELYAKPIHEFIHIDDRERTAKHRSNLLNNIPLLNFENRYVTKTGEIVWLAWTSIAVDSEKIVYAIAKNITYKKKLEEDRNTVIENLSKVNSDLKLLTSTTAHDLRAPVNNLLSVFNLLDTCNIHDTKTLDFIEMLRLATDTLKHTLNDYVDVLNEKQNASIELSEIEISDVLNTVLHSLSALIQSSKTKIQTNFAVPKIKFNRSYLESILLNLITNSIKYSRPGHFPMIYISTKHLNGLNQLIFEDEGQGFDMDNDNVKDKIFGFHQKFHNQADSKGIGLYLVYNHITSLGGKIAIESKVNEGARFTISFKN